MNKDDQSWGWFFVVKPKLMPISFRLTIQGKKRYEEIPVFMPDTLKFN